MVRKFQTDLNCGSCVAAVKPFLDREPSIERWSVDTDDPRKTLTVEGEAVSTETIEHLVAKAGFHVLGELPDSAPAHTHETTETKSFWETYRPLLLILGYLAGTVAIVDAGSSLTWMSVTRHFMGGFFLAFSFFKLLDLRGFADAYQTYDVLAGRWIVYGYVYPFIELALGIAYLSGVGPLLTNFVTLAIMLLGLVGVARALAQKRRIQCACLGTVFNLPMSKVTLIEDGVMAIMAAVMLISLLIGSPVGAEF